MSIRAEWRTRLQDVERQGLERTLRPLQMINATQADWQGRTVDVFSSNDYLGLAHHPDMQAAWQGGGAGSSRLIAGSRPVHERLERELEDLFGRPALVFSSGYQANLAVMTTLFRAHHTVGSDRLNHASIIDGLRLGSCSVQVSEHGVFAAHVDAHVAEGLYSMDGDRIDLNQNPSMFLVVDEAHSVGALGPAGRGVAAAQGRKPDVLVGTFGKSYGASGAFVVLDEEAKRLLVSQGRSFVYTTALSEPAANAALKGLALATEERRGFLRANVERFREGLNELGVPSLGTDHVVPVVLGQKTMGVAEKLLDAGIFVPGIRYPTVEKGQERLRFSLSASHTEHAIDRALEVLSECLH
ncbi:MAG: aminotransferase class I/II-fold pyridoxal phosphate-dependent enzyme [Myxococcota bacterium]|nr:aminotransferase class I/II-fold pyridoxal phosphate-dependent enzyme [Myxococcota bacterium]